MGYSLLQKTENPGRRGVLSEIPSVVGVWIFSGTTQFAKVWAIYSSSVQVAEVPLANSQPMQCLNFQIPSTKSTCMGIPVSYVLAPLRIFKRKTICYLLLQER